ncbi:hypothetical protein [Bradyrhizobium elkanii]|uniref:hypothetical protein n=1 Tax=Bradyrhizobium elkanii TaxID=29448 RepID=UPI003834FF65
MTASGGLPALSAALFIEQLRMKLLNLDVSLEEGHGSCLDLLCQYPAQFSRSSSSGNRSSGQTISVALITYDVRCTACTI